MAGHVCVCVCDGLRAVFIAWLLTSLSYTASARSGQDVMAIATFQGLVNQGFGLRLDISPSVRLVLNGTLVSRQAQPPYDAVDRYETMTVNVDGIFPNSSAPSQRDHGNGAVRMDFECIVICASR